MAGGSWAMPHGYGAQAPNPYQVKAQSAASIQPVAFGSPHSASAMGFGGAGMQHGSFFQQPQHPQQTMSQEIEAASVQPVAVVSPHTTSSLGFGGTDSAAFGGAPPGMSSNPTMQQAWPASQLPQPQMQSGSFFQQPQYSQQTMSQVASHVVLPAQPHGQAFVSNPGVPQQHGSDVPAVIGQLPSCQCGQACVELTVKKEGPNQGRLFYKCGKLQSEACQYFQWADEPPRQTTSGVQTGVVKEGAPSCNCSLTAVTFTVRKEGPNTGREFYSCPKPRGERCGFFHWGDEGVPKETPNCTCGVPTKHRTVMKDGPNRGRPFYSCAAPPPGCGLFQWGDEELQSTVSGLRGVATPARQGSRQGSDVCYKCNQPGHWASSCPNAAVDGFNKGRGRGRGGAGAGRGRTQGAEGFTGFPSDPY